MPFSDPVMDGPVIQEANDLVLAEGVTPVQILDEVARLNSAGQVVIHTITVGYESEFMRKLAAANRGEYIVAGKNKSE